MSIIHIDSKPYIVAKKCPRCEGSRAGRPTPDDPYGRATCARCNGLGHIVPDKVTEDCAKRRRIRPLGSFPAFDCPHPTHHHGRRILVPDSDAEVVLVMRGDDDLIPSRGLSRCIADARTFVARNRQATPMHQWVLYVYEGGAIGPRIEFDGLPDDAAGLVRAVEK